MYETIRAGLCEAVPFAKFVGVELLEVGDGVARARLVQRPETSNHIGTLHAGALFVLGETASGAAMTGAFAELIGRIRPVTTQSRIAYLKIARGIVSCSATVATPAAELRKSLREQQKVVFDVEVDLLDEEDQLVANLTVTWNVRLIN